ncbi:MAG: calcium-binding protein [Nitrososphaerota archaeon]
MRSAIIASIASMLICTMLLGSVLISSVYAKGSGSEKSQYNLDENCKDDHKGKQITITGTRSVEDEKTTSDTDAKIDKNALPGTVIMKTLMDGTVVPDFTDFNVFHSEDHIELPTIAGNATTTGPLVNPDGTINSDFDTTGNNNAPINPINELKIKDTLDYKKTLPLKERREFNVCNLPIGNAVDGFKYNEIVGTKKSDILLGTAAADDIKGKDGGDVIQARDDDDIVHGGKGDDSVQAGFGNDNVHADDGDDAVFAGPNDDYLNGGNGNDELYAQDGDDVLEGGPGADFFDCGPGFDTVVDFNPNEGDITNDNCEDVRTNL